MERINLLIKINKVEINDKNNLQFKNISKNMRKKMFKNIFITII